MIVIAIGSMLVVRFGCDNFVYVVLLCLSLGQEEATFLKKRTEKWVG